MSDETQKPITPAYAPYKTFIRFINGLQESTIPTQIDKSIMTRMSGGDQSAMLGALKFLKFIDGYGKPSPDFLQLIESKEEKRGPLLKAVLERAYTFIFNGAIDLKRATTKQVEDAFKAQGISGSTVTKCMAFFLTAAKEAGIEVSPHVKTPLPVRTTTRRPAAQPDSRDRGPAEDQEEEEFTPGTKKLKLPLPGKPDVVLMVPEDFSPEDWAFLKPILEAYIGRIFQGGST